jgi:hypothetical protein
MAELPASFGLTTKKRTDGKLDIIGKADNGQEYRVRTTDGPQVTDKDVQELKAADRESYANREQGIRQFVKSLTEHGQRQQDSYWNNYENELTEAAGPVVHAGLERRGSTLGSTWAYRHGWEKLNWNDKESN